jgi:flavin reductase (DIM6/NTAB) family NADH-FMN oxidoreductase RutF
METTWTSEDLNRLEKTYRAKFINCLSGPKSANLIGTVDANGNENLSIVSSCVHLGADPALLGMVIRPRSVPRHTFDNLIETGFWTVNHATPALAKAAHQTSARYPKEVSEFAAVGLTPEYRGSFLAPYVRESVVQMGLKLIQVMPILHNDTEFVIGEILEVHFDDLLLQSDGYLDLAEAQSLAVSGLDHYLTTNSLFRLSYAKPDSSPEEIG